MQILKQVPAVLMIIRGIPTDDKLDLANTMAGGPAVFRRIIWAKEPIHIEPVITSLAKKDGVTFDEDTAALFISLNGVISSTLQSFSDFEPANIMKGFTAAQANKRPSTL